MTKERATVSMETGFCRKRLGPATTLYRTNALSFVIPSEAEGSAVLRTLRGYVFLQSATDRRDLRFLFGFAHTL